MYSFDRIGFAKRFRETVLSDNRTVREISKCTNIIRACIYKYMSGESVPNTEALAKICIVFDISADWLLFGRGDKSA